MPPISPVQAAVGLGGAGSACAAASAALPETSPEFQFEAAAAGALIPHASTHDETAARADAPKLRTVHRAGALKGDQLVQLSVTGPVVAVAAPPVAVTPVSDGMEK